MTQRIALLSDTVEDAKQIVETLRTSNVEDDNIYVVTQHDVVMEDLPEADPRQYSDLFPAAKRGAGIGGAMGLFGGLLMATFPPAGIAFGGAAVGAMAAGGAAFGAWTSSLVGISVPNSTLEDFQNEVENGATLVLADIDDEHADSLLGKMQTICRAQLIKADTVETA